MAMGDMTLEQLERIKDEAREQASLAMCFATPTQKGLLSIGENAEFLMYQSFIQGAKFALSLEKEKNWNDRHERN